MKIPGRLKWGDIELKRGITSSLDLWEWRAMVEDGNVAEARKNGTITMFNQELTAVAKWDFNLGWPSKIDGPSLKADDNSVVLESITITHEGITRVQV